MDIEELVINKFRENPGKFAATILKMYWDMKKQCDQYKSENEKLRERNKKLEKRFNQKVRRNVRGGLQQMKIEDLESKCDGMKTENEQLKAQRDTLTDDIAVLKAKVSRLERENRKLRVKSDSFFESWRFKSVMYTDLSKESDEYKSLLSEFSQLIGNKPSSSTYKYFRAKLDGLGIEGDE